MLKRIKSKQATFIHKKQKKTLFLDVLREEEKILSDLFSHKSFFKAQIANNRLFLDG